MGNVQRDIHGNFAMKRCRMKMVILSIDDEKLLKENAAKLKSKEYGSTINVSFRIVLIFPNVIMLTSMSKSPQLSVLLNIFSNMFSKVEIVQLLSYKVK